VAQRGGSCGAVLNAANEAAVDAYRAGQINFGEITELVADTLSRHSWSASPSLDELLEFDAWARNEVSACLKC
jgi:1-deoxy-D-xylulose-5-phosphate reductoisomerase